MQHMRQADEPQLLSITMDSASNNDALSNELAALLPGIYRGLRARVRCMDHVVNIAARRAMLMFDATPVELARALDEAVVDLERMGDDITEATDAPVNEDDESDVMEPAGSDDLGVELGDAFEGMSEEGKEDLHQQLEPMRESISKVRTFHLVPDRTLTDHSYGS